MSIMINDTAIGQIITDILGELARSKEKHPNYPADTLRREAIVIEEGLEAAEIMLSRLTHLQKVTLGVTRISAKDVFTMLDLRKELVQTAAMCVKFLESMDKEGA